MKKRFKSSLSILFLLVLLVGLVGCGSSSSDTDGESKTAKPKEEWTTVIEFNGSFSGTQKEAFSDVFELTGGSVRITYDLVTTSTGGNALIYILPDGWTKSTDDEGNLDVAIQDVSAMGDKTGERKILTKDAGKYYIDINTSSVESYNIKIEEKK